jgi:hypothetical protein
MVEHAPRKSRRAKVLKLADKTSNIRSIANDPPGWSARRRLAYVQWGRDVVVDLSGASPQLERLFDEAPVKLRRQSPVTRAGTSRKEVRYEENEAR